MSFLYSRKHLNEGDVVSVKCSHQCNIRLLTDSNFTKYKEHKKFSRHGGGFYKKFPAKITAPSAGNWYIVLDLAGGTAHITYSISIIRRD